MSDVTLDVLVEEDELDLVTLVSTNANDLNQYLVFEGSNLEWYAMNVSKIEEVMVYDTSIELAHNTDKSSIVFATADIRNSMTTLIYFDDWYGNKRLEDTAYELIILANYGGHKLGIIVKSVANISTIQAKDMSNNAQNNAKSTFIAKILIEGEEQMCTIYDGDQMLLDIFDNVQLQSEYVFNQVLVDQAKNKVVFFADDSKFVRNLVEELFIKLGLSYKIFNDGSFLMEYLHRHPDETIDLFITDLEMPHLGGRDVVLGLKANSTYQTIPVLIHTNMSSDAMEDELKDIGARKIISKMNMQNLGNAILEELG